MSDDLIGRLRQAHDMEEGRGSGLFNEAADEIERLLDIVEKVAMGSFLDDTMYDAIRDARKYISAIPTEG